MFSWSPSRDLLIIAAPFCIAAALYIAYVADKEISRSEKKE